MTRALLIVDHGSRRPEAHAHLEQIAQAVRSATPELRVYIAHMELAPPSIEQAVEVCVRDGVHEIVVHPFFLSPGRHLTTDLPELVERAVARHTGVAARITTAVGAADGIAELIRSTLD